MSGKVQVAPLVTAQILKIDAELYRTSDPVVIDKLIGTLKQMVIEHHASILSSRELNELVMHHRAKILAADMRSARSDPYGIKT